MQGRCRAVIPNGGGPNTALSFDNSHKQYGAVRNHLLGHAGCSEELVDHPTRRIRGM